MLVVGAAGAGRQRNPSAKRGVLQKNRFQKNRHPPPSGPRVGRVAGAGSPQTPSKKGDVLQDISGLLIVFLAHSMPKTSRRQFRLGRMARPRVDGGGGVFDSLAGWLAVQRRWLVTLAGSC